MQSMARYVGSRLIQAIITIFFMLILNFLIINLAPGSPVTILAGDIAISDPEFVRIVEERWGLDKPLLERFIDYLSNVLRGDFGYSFRHSEYVTTLIFERLGATLLLTVTSLFVAFIIGTLLGAFSARSFPSRVDVALSFVALTLYSIPVFLLGLIFILLFGVWLHLFPVAGISTVTSELTGIWSLLDVLYHSAVPISTLALVYMPIFYKITRASTLEQLRENYVNTLKCFGLRKSTIFQKFILKNAMLPPVTTLGIQLGYTLTGAALIETIFAWPGIGRLLLDAAFYRDYPLLMGLYLLMSIGVTFAAILTDLLYMILDPRIRYR